MSKRLNIFVACGSGIATSTVAADKIEEVLKEKGLKNYKINKISMTELQGALSSADVIFTTNKYRGEHDVPIMSVVPFITGIGEQKKVEEVSTLIDQVLEEKED